MSSCGSLKRIQEGDEGIPVRLGKVHKPLARVRALAAVPEDGLLEIAGAAVMEEVGVAVDLIGQADSPKGRECATHDRRRRLPGGGRRDLRPCREAGGRYRAR